MYRWPWSDDEHVEAYPLPRRSIQQHMCIPLQLQIRIGGEAEGNSKLL